MPVFSCAILSNYPLEVTNSNHSKTKIHTVKSDGVEKWKVSFLQLPRIEVICIGLLLTALVVMV
jgi:hypothetical protein